MSQSTFAVGVGTDDGQVFGSAASYPPTFGLATNNGTTDSAAKNQTAGPTFAVRNFLVRFDTSALPDDAIIDAATLQLHVTAKNDNNARNLVGEWYAGANWPIDVADGAITPGSDAFTLDITAVTAGQVNNIALSSPSNVNKSGYTGFRIGVDGGSPASTNDVTFSAYDHPTNQEPRLVVDYHLPGGETGAAVFSGADYYYRPKRG